MVKGKKIWSILLTGILCFCMALPAKADDISDAKAKQSELEEQKKAAEAEQSELSKQLDSIMTKMEKTQEDLTAKETEINDAETELVLAKVEEDDQYQTMKKRIKYMYENGNTEFIEILMESKSISDFLNNAEYINRISRCDRELLDDFKKVREDIEKKEEALKKEYAELETLQDELEEEQTSVQALLEDKNIQIDNLSSEISSNAEKLKNLIAEAEAAEARRQQAASGSGYQSGGGSNNIVVSGNGQLSHPVPGAVITSGFGYRDAPTAGATYSHDGIDYGAGAGSPIYAADSGTVITATFNGARGYYVVINHGNGMQTWYQHCSALYVSVGQSVSRGQNIAAVGSTGVSTGPHLHFEVHVNGVPVDPLGYL